MNTLRRLSGVSVLLIGVGALLIAFDAFLVVMTSVHGFPTEIFTRDQPLWHRSVVFTWSDGLILAALALGHIVVAWAYVRHRRRRV